MEFPSPQAFCERMTAQGFTASAFTPLSAGIAGIFTGLKGAR
jgi:hypothetical protein